MKMNVTLNTSDQTFSIGFATTHNFSAGFENIQVVTDTGGIPAYRGEYVVTPRVNGTVLETAKKYMTDDVTVKAIPFYDVSNDSGGTTVYIANELD